MTYVQILRIVDVGTQDESILEFGLENSGFAESLSPIFRSVSGVNDFVLVKN